MRVTVSGRFPIVERGEHPVRAAIEEWRARGETTPEAAADPRLLAAQEVATHDLIAAQESAGIDLLGEGYVPVYDEWFAWAASVEGVAVESPIRYLDTNTYYHRWRLVGQMRRCGPSPLVASYVRAARLTDRPIKPGLFGPYTLWAYANREGAPPEAFDALVEICAAEVADLAAAGTRWIQIEESVLLRPRHRGDLPRIVRAVERIARAAPDATLILYLGCGVVGELLQPLLAIPGLGGLGLDFTDVYRAPNLAALAGWHGDLLLQAGIADARHVRIETPEELTATLDMITERVPAESCLAAPSTALLYLPYHYAFEKLAVMAATAHSYSTARGGRTW